MHLILLSGGSGKRLWPLSNDVRSKQFIKILKDEEGKPESMVQRVYRQLKEVGGWDSITVAAGESQKDQLELQLGKDVNLVIEPERRDTFPAIALACSYLLECVGVKENETIAVLPVDPFVELDYFQCVSKIDDVINSSRFKDSLVLLGAKPVIATDKYGYIIPKMESDDSGTLAVLRFKEKPTIEESEKLIEEGALWNCGVFGLQLGYILNILRNKYKISDLSFKAMQQTFKSLHKTSFDYEVVEKAENIKVIPYEGQWKDIGTFLILTEEMATQSEGNVILDDTCDNNTHVINELGVPLVVLGMKDAVVVATNDGILVSDKKETHRIKEVTASIGNRPMYERKRWGKYKVIEHTVYQDGTEALTKKLIIEEDKQISYQFHNYRKEVWTILSGTGILILEDQQRTVNPGDTIVIEEKQKHGIRAITNMEIIEVQMGQPLAEDDIVRIDLNW